MQSLKIAKCLVLFLSIVLPGFAQFPSILKIKITDIHQHPLVGATVVQLPSGQGSTSNKWGDVELPVTSGTQTIVRTSFLGYNTSTDTILIPPQGVYVIRLTENAVQLDDFTVSADIAKRNASSLAMQIVDKDFVRANGAGSLMQSLSRLPGVGSMDIGAGQSKPSIRGLGFNRIVVAENGMKHQAQEWGADHGLEIDPYMVERIEIIKGPASLMYGANAMAGVIDIKQTVRPEKHTKQAEFDLYAHSNNALTGFAFKYTEAKEKWYWRMFVNQKSYADFKIPTDSITYMTYNIKLKNKRLRNTAGFERNPGFALGFVDKYFSSHWRVNVNETMAGFFANAHGLEIRNSQIDYDAKMRDIDLPSQKVLHTKVMSNNIVAIKDYLLTFDFGFQRNYRQEFSEAVAHGYMPTPPDSLERLYNKTTWTAMLKMQMPKHKVHKLNFGINAELQKNKIGGWGFLLPNFAEKTVGAYLLDEVLLNKTWKLNAGIRYDYIALQTSDYFDWYATPQTNGSNIHVQRAKGIDRQFGNFSWAIGSVAKIGVSTLKLNAGKSFRTPTAKELASNGINYHMYRFERGDSSLRPEQSYQLDLQWALKTKKWQVEISPFLNYFDNYIYLNPTANYYEAQQIYNYSQSKVFRAGGEVLVDYSVHKNWTLTADVEYVFSQQLSGAKKGYSLPFSPPMRTHFAVAYQPKALGIFTQPIFGTELEFVSAQNNIVPPEKKTSAFALLHLNASTTMVINKFKAKVNMELKNVLNTRYYDHTSFYRLIEVPGMGRNLMLNVGFEI